MTRILPQKIRPSAQILGKVVTLATSDVSSEVSRGFAGDLDEIQLGILRIFGREVPFKKPSFHGRAPEFSSP